MCPVSFVERAFINRVKLCPALGVWAIMWSSRGHQTTVCLSTTLLRSSCKASWLVSCSSQEVQRPLRDWGGEEWRLWRRRNGQKTKHEIASWGPCALHSFFIDFSTCVSPPNFLSSLSNLASNACNLENWPRVIPLLNNLCSSPWLFCSSSCN